MPNLMTLITKLDQFEKNLPGLLENQVGSILADGNNRLRQKFQTLYQVLLTKIDEYSGVKSTEELNLEPLTLRSLSARQPSFTAAQGRIEEWRDELEARKMESSSLRRDSEQMADELQETQQSEASVQVNQQNIEARWKRDLADMGSRPEARWYEEPYTEHVPHGGLGILDFFLGNKEVIRYCTVRDDSAGERWDRQRAQIQNTFAVRNDALSKELAAARRRKSDISARWDVNQAKLKSVEEKIRKLEGKIALESEKLEREKKLAAQEYMELRKASMQQQVQTYLLGESSVLTRTEANMASASEEIVQSFINLSIKRFKQALQHKLQWIEQMKQEKSPEILQQAENLGGICQKLHTILMEMERG